MKPNNKELTQKKYIQTEKEYWKLQERIRNIPWRKLEEPYQEGWTVSLVVKETILNKKEGKDILKAINICPQNKQVLRDPAKVSKLRKNPGYDQSMHLFMYEDYKGVWTYAGPNLSRISKKDWENLTLEELPQRIRNEWFDKHVRTYGIGPNPPKVISYICTVPRNYLEYKVKKRIVTHVQDVNPELLKRKAELEEILKPYWRTFNYHGRHWDQIRDKKTERKHVNDAIQKVKKGEIEDVKQYKKLGKRG